MKHNGFFSTTKCIFIVIFIAFSGLFTPIDGPCDTIQLGEHGHKGVGGAGGTGGAGGLGGWPGNPGDPGSAGSQGGDGGDGTLILEGMTTGEAFINNGAMFLGGLPGGQGATGASGAKGGDGGRGGYAWESGLPGKEPDPDPDSSTQQGGIGGYSAGVGGNGVRGGGGGGGSGTGLLLWTANGGNGGKGDDGAQGDGEDGGSGSDEPQTITTNTTNSEPYQLGGNGGRGGDGGQGGAGGGGGGGAGANVYVGPWDGGAGGGAGAGGAGGLGGASGDGFIEVRANGTFINQGTVDVGRGGSNGAGTVTVMTGGWLVNDGTMDIADNGNLRLQGGTLDNNDTINNGNTIDISASSTLNNSGTFTNGHTLTNDGYLENSGILHNNHTLNNSGTLENSGRLNITGALVNPGTLDNTGILDITAGGTITTRGGTIHNTGTMSSDPSFENNGAFHHSAGTFAVNDNLISGQDAIDTGTYSLSGTGTLLVTGMEYTGYNGAGIFTQQGGLHGVQNNLHLGYGATGTGTYTLAGGTLEVDGQLRIGADSGTGRFEYRGGTIDTPEMVFGSRGTLALGMDFNVVDDLAAGSPLFLQVGHITGLAGIILEVTNDATATHDSGPATFSGLVLGSKGSSGAYTLSGGGLTVTGDITGGGGTGTMTLDGGALSVGGDISVDYFSLGGGAGNSGAYTLSGSKAVSVQVDMSVGGHGTGTYNQTGGSHTVMNDLYLGHESDGSGIYALSGSGSLSVGGREIVGHAGTGTFTQNGGSHSAGALYLGYSNGGTGTYDLNGGILSASEEFVGYNGTGFFSQEGAWNAVSGTLTIGQGAGSSGVYSLRDGGMLEVDGQVRIGADQGTGRLEFREGTIDTPEMVLGSNGTLALETDFNVGNLVDGTLFSAVDAVSGLETAALEVTNDADATHTAGTAAFSRLQIGHGLTGGGTYAMSAGSLEVGTEIRIGADGGSGKLTFTGGTIDTPEIIFGTDGTLAIGTDFNMGHLVDGSLFLPGDTITMTGLDQAVLEITNNATATHDSGSAAFSALTLIRGHYTLSNGALSVTGDENVGSSHDGTFSQNGGVNGIGGTLTLGYGPTASGIYTLTGGTLDVTGDILGGAGESELIIDGGSLGVGGRIDVDYLKIGNGPGSIKTYMQEPGYDISAGEEFIGYEGTGIHVQNGGIHEVSADLHLGSQTGGRGTYTLAGGTLDIGGDILNGSGTATLNVDGGMLYMSGSIDVDVLMIGSSAGASGSLIEEHHTDITAIEEYIGYAGTGTLTQRGGDVLFSEHTVTTNLYLGYSSESSGTYTLSDGHLTVGHSEYVGYEGLADFSQTGGMHHVQTDLHLGSESGSIGTYTLSGGTLRVDGGIVNGGGTGILNLDNIMGLEALAGELDVAGSIDVDVFRLGYDAAAFGKHTQGAGHDIRAFDEYIGYKGRGEFIHEGGSHNVTRLYLGGDGDPSDPADSSSSAGIYTLRSGGIITVDNTEYVGYEGTGDFFHEDGSHTVSGDMIIGYGSASKGDYRLGGGSLEVGGRIRVGGFDGDGRFEYSGGNLLATEVTLGSRGTLAMGADFNVMDDLAGGSALFPHVGTITFSPGAGLEITNDATATHDGGSALFSKLNLGSGLYHLQGGTLQVSGDIISESHLIGAQGIGSMFMDSGVLDVVGTIDVDGLAIGYSPGSNVTHTLEEGQTLIAGGGGIFGIEPRVGLNIGFEGTGTFIQNGGGIAAGDFNLGVFPGSSGTYYLHGGSLITAGNPLVPMGWGAGGIGLGGNGTFIHGGGSHTATIFAMAFAGTGTYELSGADSSLLTHWGGIGMGGVATFRQSGGTHTANLLQVGYDSEGIYDLSGGELYVADTLAVGFLAGSAGEFILGGGLLTADVQIGIGIGSGSGRFEYRGGAIETPEMVFGSMGTLAMGMDFNVADDLSAGSALFPAVGAITGLENAGIEVTNDATATHDSGTATFPELRIGTNGSGGTYNLEGGTLNAPTIVGDGGIFNYSGGALHGDMSSSGNVVLSGTGTRAVDGTVTNEEGGTFRVTNTTAAFTGPFMNNGAYISDPSYNYFNDDLIIGESGYLQGGPGDSWILGGHFTNNSTMGEAWDTFDSHLFFVDGKSTQHELYWSGSDMGASGSGYGHNFAWGSLTIEDGQSLKLFDGNGDAGGALYLRTILGLEDEIVNGWIMNIFGYDGMNIYYLAYMDDNAYLNGLTYNLQNGGFLIPVNEAPVPIPGSFWLFASALIALLGLRLTRGSIKS
ncbi:MAG: hypothetical protein JRJ85_00180 [Deltaproteobacteria bacterium]|nr:hypothetical protein [Deltaproteobacteria bacterium]